MIEGEPQRGPGLPHGEDPRQLSTHDGVVQHLEGLAVRHGFACFALITLPASNQEHLKDNVTFSNLALKFIRAYDALLPFKTSPLFARLRATTAPFGWRLDDEESRPTDGTSGARKLFSEQRFMGGVVIPLVSPEGVRAGAIYAGNGGLLSRQELADLMLSTVDAYDAICRLRQEPPTAMSKLSDREIQVLGWAANGKTSVEIATILSLSDHTVNSYLNSAMRKMDCVNRTQLVAKALRLHLIS